MSFKTTSGVAAGACVGVTVGVGSAVGVGVGVAVGSVVGVGVGVAVGSAVGMGVGRSTGAAVTIGVGVGVTTGVSSLGPQAHRVSSSATIGKSKIRFIGSSFWDMGTDGPSSRTPM